jgi:hypothetical protein
MVSGVRRGYSLETKNFGMRQGQQKVELVACCALSDQTRPNIFRSVQVVDALPKVPSGCLKPPIRVYASLSYVRRIVVSTRREKVIPLIN